jgi:hypothetical protein
VKGAVNFLVVFHRGNQFLTNKKSRLWRDSYNVVRNFETYFFFLAAFLAAFFFGAAFFLAAFFFVAILIEFNV